MSESTFETYITLTGQVILNKLLAGQNILITRAVLSSQTSEIPEELTALNPEAISTSNISLTDRGDYTDIELAFDFTSLENDLYFRSLGIYGKVSNSEEKLIFVSLVNEENQLVIPAHSPITYILTIKETFAVGHLEVYISPDYATPISHHSDFTRHIFSQTNSSASLALVNSGATETFANNDSILFIPKVDMNHGSKIRIASKEYTLSYRSIQGSVVSTGVFKAHRPYVLYFNNNSFLYKEKEVYVDNGILTYWNGSSLKTVSDNINNIFRIQNGILHYYSNNAWHSTMPAGMINAFARSSTPTGYLLCNGWEYNKSDYPELFSVIGYTYGGSGEKFKVPNLTGKMMLGSNSSHPLGSTDGAETKTISVSNLPSHNHSLVGDNNDSPNKITYKTPKIKGIDLLTNPRFVNVQGGGNASVPTIDALVQYVSPDPTEQALLTGNTKSTGNNSPLNVMNPYTVVNFYISTGRSLI